VLYAVFEPSPIEHLLGRYLLGLVSAKHEPLASQSRILFFSHKKLFALNQTSENTPA